MIRLWDLALTAVALFMLSVTWPYPSRAEGARQFPAYKVVVKTIDGKELMLNKHQSLIVNFEPQDPSDKTIPEIVDFNFDARMPQHKHGMVTTAKTVKVSASEYRVDGVRLHMPGMWVFEFTLIHKSGETRISSPLELKP